METNNTNSVTYPEPTVGSSYGFGWDVMWKAFIELLVVTLVYGIIQIPTGGLRIQMDTIKEFQFHLFIVPIILFAIAYGIFISGPIGFSVKWVFLKAIRKEKIEIKDMFSVFQTNYWNAVLAGVIVAMIIGLGIIMLIVPGIIFACRLAFVPYLVIDKRMEAMEALKTSWEMTRGYGWQIFLMGLLAIPIVLAGLMMLFFGVILSIIWISAAFATIYYSVSQLKGTPEIEVAK